MMGTSYVYLIESTSGHFKIGKSNDPQLRLKQLQRTQGPYQYRLILSIPFHSEEEALNFETICHEEHRSQRVRGEWFTLTARDLLDWGATAELYMQIFYKLREGGYGI